MEQTRSQDVERWSHIYVKSMKGVCGYLLIDGTFKFIVKYNVYCVCLDDIKCMTGKYSVNVDKWINK